MLSHRRGRWSNIKPSLVQCLVSAEQPSRQPASQPPHQPASQPASQQEQRAIQSASQPARAESHPVSQPARREEPSPNLPCLRGKKPRAALQSQKPVSAYLKNQQMLPVVFAWLSTTSYNDPA